MSVRFFRNESFQDNQWWLSSGAIGLCSVIHLIHTADALLTSRPSWQTERERTASLIYSSVFHFSVNMLQLSCFTLKRVSCRLTSAALQVVRRSQPSRSATSVMSSQDEMLPRTLRRHNGQKVKGTFSTQEMQRRVDMIRKHMEVDEIDACVFTSIHNVNYFSDFLYCSFGRPYAFIVTPEKTLTVSAGEY